MCNGVGDFYQRKNFADLTFKFLDAVSLVQVLMETRKARALFVDLWIELVEFFQQAPFSSGDKRRTW